MQNDLDHTLMELRSSIVEKPIFTVIVDSKLVPDNEDLSLPIRELDALN